MWSFLSNADKFQHSKGFLGSFVQLFLQSFFTALQLCFACKCFSSHHLTSYFDPCIVCIGVSTPIKNTTSLRLEQITFCQRTNFRIHKGTCSAWSCTQKSCTRVVVMHWNKKNFFFYNINFTRHKSQVKKLK